MVTAVQKLDTKHANELEECQAMGPEEGHIKADELLCELLAELGFTKTVQAFKALRKWYA